MAIPKVAPRTILLVGKDYSIMKEAPAAAAITPGHLVQFDANSKWKVHAVAKGQAIRAFAAEADLIGNGIDDAYAANDIVYAWIVPAGAEVNALVAPSAAAIVVGDLVESAGDGTVRKLTPASQLGTGTYDYTAEGNAIGVAIQAVDNSSNAVSSARIQIRVI